MKRVAFVAVLVLAVVGIWLGWSWYAGRDLVLSQAPERAASDNAPTVRTSIVAANLRVPFTVLISYLNRLSDQLASPQSGSQDIQCAEIDKPIIGGVWWRECLTVHWHVEPGRDGPISLSREGNRFRIGVPAKVTGGAGFGGDIARLLSLSDKSFGGAFAISAAASVTLDSRFCPVISVEDVGFDWKQVLEVEVVGNNEIEPIPGFKIGIGAWRLPIGNLLTGTLRAALTDGLRKAAGDIPCDSVRAQLAKLWHTYSVPVGLPSLPAFVNAKPTLLSSPGIIVEDAALRLEARLAAAMEVSTVAAPETPLGDLPPNRPTPDQPGMLSLAVPVVASFDALTAAAKSALDGKAYDVPIGSGTARITIHDIEVYPSQDRVAVGVKFTAKVPSRIFDVSGMLWLAGRPVVDATGTKVSLADVSLARQVDNPAWSAFTVLAAGELAKQVEGRVAYDLSKPIADAKQSIAGALQDQSKTGGVRLSVTDLKLALGRVAVAREGLFVEGLLSGGLQTQLDAIPGPPR